ncbi:MAG: glycoside hydrolase family protein [Clostridia bacterium]|nr:glycoside hydrolase family protein [Clostridia bacterium]
MTQNFPFRPGRARVAFAMEDYYIWDCSVIYAEGKYHMFSSRWPKKYGFGWNWLLNSEIVHAVSDTPEGPYEFASVVLPRRGREYFDGMNTHNTCIKAFGGKYYLYYMGTTYPADMPCEDGRVKPEHALETWNRKRIGLAVADCIDGPYVRCDKPLMEPRDPSHWDCTCTTNPSVAILPDGETYMIYKSRAGAALPLKLGIAHASSPAGPFERLSDQPILQFPDSDYHMEDPFVWYDSAREVFCMIAKDDVKNGSFGITGEWGAGFYAESRDCMDFDIAPEPKVYSRTVTWEDGTVTTQGNLERPSLLFDENGTPTHLFCASGRASSPYAFEDTTFIVCIPLEKK